MKLLKISNFYTKSYLSKGSLISILVSFLIVSIYCIYNCVSNTKNYYYSYLEINELYIENSFNVLNIILIFIISFIFIREANLLSDSSNLMLESSFKRSYIFIAKQISIISIVFCISLAYYLILFIPPYFNFKLFKFDFFTSYLRLLLYLLIIIELLLMFDYLFKNYFISSIIGIVILIISFINNLYLSYIIPIAKVIEQNISFDINIYYAIMYLLIILVIDFILYNKLDRK